MTTHTPTNTVQTTTPPKFIKARMERGLVYLNLKDFLNTLNLKRAEDIRVDANQTFVADDYRVNQEFITEDQSIEIIKKQMRAEKVTYRWSERQSTVMPIPHGDIVERVDIFYPNEGIIEKAWLRIVIEN